MRFHHVLAAGFIPAMLITGSPASSQSLNETLSMAYHYNPRLDAERARLRAIDEEVPRAYATFQPTISTQAFTGSQRVETRPADPADGSTRPNGVSLTLTQPIFNGLRSVNQLREAEAGARGGREQLRNVEQSVLLEAVSAYIDVVRDQALVHARERLLDVLSRERAAIQAQLTEKLVTGTDLSQVKARLSGAAAELDLARGALQQSRAQFERVAGSSRTLGAAPPIMRLLPASLHEAASIAVEESPTVGAALYREEAARYSVERVRGELLPEVRLEARLEHRLNTTALADQLDTAEIQGRMTIPLYTGGDIEARVRQAKHTHVSRLQEIEQNRSEIKAQVEAAWAQLTAAKASLANIEMQLASSRTALAGVREELKAGYRTVLEVLNAEQEIIAAEVAEASARRNVVQASYALLSAIGRFSIENLGTGDAVYDPTEHAQEAREARLSASISENERGGTMSPVEPVTYAASPKPRRAASVVPPAQKRAKLAKAVSLHGPVKEPVATYKAPAMKTVAAPVGAQVDTVPPTAKEKGLPAKNLPAAIKPMTESAASPDKPAPPALRSSITHDNVSQAPPALRGSSTDQ